MRSARTKWLLAAAFLLGCGGGGGGGGTGGQTATGGSTGTGGSGTGGSGTGGSGTGGAATGGSAGSSATGGASGQGGAAGAAGKGGVGGAAGAAGAAGGAAGAAGNPCASTADAGTGPVLGPATLAGTATRPQLEDADAPNYTVLKYLAQAGSVTAPTTDNWDPTAGVGDVSTFVPTRTVATDGSGTDSTVQAAITASSTDGGTGRVYILVKPGTYREVVCVPKTAPPITLYGANADATQVTIVFNNYAGKTTDSGANPCAAAGSSTYGTSASATFAVFASGFAAKNVTFSNDYVEASSSNQAVALETQGDKLVFENVRALGNQDTLYIKSSGTGTVARAYFKNSYVEGDVDFIFGRGTAVFDGCTLNYLTARQGSKGGNYLAPSTAPNNMYGFLVTKSTFTAQSGTPTNLIALGRAWDESVTCYMGGVSPNGQALVRNSTMGSWIRTANPWSIAATSGRVYSATGNRLWEYQNSGPGAAGGATDGGVRDGGSRDAAIQ
jgi:pectinesterase